MCTYVMRDHAVGMIVEHPVPPATSLNYQPSISPLVRTAQRPPFPKPKALGNIYIYTYIYVCICIHIYIYICMRTYIYIYA